MGMGSSTGMRLLLYGMGMGSSTGMRFLLNLSHSCTCMLEHIKPDRSHLPCLLVTFMLIGDLYVYW